MKAQWMIAPALLLAACGGETPAPVEQAAKPARLPAGEWEVTSVAESLKSTDNSTPALDRKQGDSVTRKACVAADGKADALLLATGDKCSSTSNYNRDGRINASWTCQRPGNGQLNPAVDGKYTADTFEAVVTTGTWFSGSGDYTLSEKVTARRLGDCPAAAAPAAD